MIKSILFVLMLAGFVFCSNTDPTAQVSGAYLVRGTNVRLRTAPTINAERVALLQGGDAFQVTLKTTQSETIAGQQGHWYQGTVETGPEAGKSGWVFEPLLVPKDQGPYSLVSSASQIEDHDQAIQALNEIIRDFPRYSDVGLYSFQEIARAEIDIRECWKSRISEAGARSQADLLQKLREAITSGKADDLRRLTSCSFIFMEGACAGDPLPRPATKEEIVQIRELAIKVDWSKTNNDCAPMAAEGDFCYSFQKTNGRYFFDFICTEIRVPPDSGR